MLRTLCHRAMGAPAMLGDVRPTEYLFTDVGSSVVAAARKRLADVPGIEYQVFDLESDPAIDIGVPATGASWIMIGMSIASDSRAKNSNVFSSGTRKVAP